MALSAFLEIPGVKGSSIQKGREGLITVNGVVHDAQSDWSVVTKKGTPLNELNSDLSAIDSKVKYLTSKSQWRLTPGKVAHKPLVITKGLDAASPVLRNHMVLSDKGATIFPQIILNFWRNPPFGGQEENYFTIKFRNAFVLGIKLVMQNNKTPSLELFPEQEEVSFGFTEVYYEYKTNGGGAAKAEKSNSDNLDAAMAFPEAQVPNVILQGVATQTIGNLLKGGAGIMYDLAGKKVPAPPAAPPEEP